MVRCKNFSTLMSHMGHKPPICDCPAMSASPPKATAALRRAKVTRSLWVSPSRSSLFRSRVYLDWSAWVRFLQASHRVGNLRKFGPANDIEISSGDRVASDLDRSPLLIALYPRGDNSHKIDAPGLDRLGKRERKNLPIFGRLIFIPGRLITHWRTSPIEKLRRASASAKLVAP
jgi:hypothetical protein